MLTVLPLIATDTWVMNWLALNQGLLSGVIKYMLDHAYQGFIQNTRGKIWISPRAYSNFTKCISDKARHWVALWCSQDIDNARAHLSW